MKNNDDSILISWARKVCLRKFQELSIGQITIVEAGASTSFGSSTSEFPLEVKIQVHDPRLYLEVMTKGLNGAAEAYIQGWWDCPNLTSLIQIFIRNYKTADSLERGWAAAAGWLLKFHYFLQRNNKQGSRRNIEAHYDLSNEFFSNFLDETMMYSCGIFKTKSSSLFEASTYKNERICQKLDLSPNDHLLEIGTGWGGFAIHAASHYGCRVTTTTISKNQFEFAQKAIAQRGLSDRIEVVMQDYRDLQGQYDKLVSIEMIEAVGSKYFKTYFKKCGELLKPEGLMLLQGIVISENYYEQAKKEVDFIKKYIFPGSCIPSISALYNCVAQQTDMNLVHLEDITSHYATTLQHWRDRFFKNLESIKKLGFSDAFARMWNYYFCYCEAGFLEHHIGNVHMLMAKPLNRRKNILPELKPASAIQPKEDFQVAR